jgi:hypothetical protein
MDSLQVLRLIRCFAWRLHCRQIQPRTIYLHPTVELLTRALQEMAHHINGPKNGKKKDLLNTRLGILEKYIGKIDAIQRCRIQNPNKSRQRGRPSDRINRHDWILHIESTFAGPSSQAHLLFESVSKLGYFTYGMWAPVKLTPKMTATEAVYGPRYHPNLSWPAAALNIPPCAPHVQALLSPPGEATVIDQHFRLITQLVKLIWEEQPTNYGVQITPYTYCYRYLVMLSRSPIDRAVRWPTNFVRTGLPSTSWFWS